MRVLLSALLLIFALPVAAEELPVPKPTMLSVFVCETVPGHYVSDMAKQGTQVIQDVPGWRDTDWAYSDKTGVLLKVCERQFLSIHDMAADMIAVAERPVPVEPDASDPAQCAWLAMQIITVLKDAGVIAACPRPVYDNKTVTMPHSAPTRRIIGYTDPPCPPDVDCINEPEDL